MRTSAPRLKRLDIQGLRAVAVLAVVSNHLTGFPGGGFVGVDIFFVISGFVITMGLVREHEKTGSISFRDFYFRRIARIMPAGTLAIVATVIVGYFAFFAERAHGILLDGVWASLFSANWRFALNGTDYWTEDSPVSPLQHYWSLGVEEQFYFVWPLLALLVLSLASKLGLSSAPRRGVLVAVLGFVITISFIWALIETSENASVAYFSTLSRAWELGLGALLAVAAPIFGRIGHRTRSFMGWSGVVGIIISVAIIQKTFAFPAPWAALPVASAALVIIAGSGGSVPRFGFLTNTVFAYIGNASYSLYLWHFPVIIFMSSLWPADDLLYYPVTILLMAFLATASYEFFEIPAQREITSWRTNGFRFGGRRSKPERPSSRLRYLGVGALIVAVAVVVPASFHHVSTTGSGYVTGPVPAEVDTAPVIDTSESRLSTQIEAALSAEAWPDLQPSLDNLVTESVPEEDAYGCGNTDLQKPDCTFGTDKEKTVVVLGDSTGITLLPTVRLAMGDTYNIKGITKAGCVVLDIPFEKESTQDAEECEIFKAAAIAEINRIKPAIVLLSNTAGSHAKLSTGTPISQAGPEWQGGTQRVLEALQPSGAKLVVISAPPSGKSPADCATRTSTPRDCIYQVPQAFGITANAMAESAKAVGATFINTRSWFCNEAGYCPAFVGDTPVKRDSIHTTKQYAATLVEVFNDAMAAATTT